MSNSFTFLMLFDDTATPMMEAVMASSMALRFPACRFEVKQTQNPDFADIVIPVANTELCGDEIGSFVMTPPPADLTEDIREAFDDLLREARAAQLS